MAGVVTAQRATSARLLLVSSGYGGRLSRVVVVLTVLSSLTMFSMMLLLVYGGGIWGLNLHRAKASPGPYRCRQRRHLQVPNSLLKMLPWCSECPDPSGVQLRCIRHSRWVPGLFGVSIALVWGG
jgi:hypothetical protein